MVPSPLNIPFFLLLLAIGLLAPGWLLGRALCRPAGVLGAFLGSAVLLLSILLGLEAVVGEFSRITVALCLAVTCAILLSVAKWRQPRAAPPKPSSERFAFHRYYWFLAPAAIGLLAIAVKSSFDPLSGLDTKFRWDFLAREMAQEGNLRFYPPVSGEDFLHYPWCDGIAPLVSSLYYWAYLSFGSFKPEATAPIVIGQAILLFAAVYELAKCRGGPAAGCAAAGVLATSAILLSGVAIGQETGMTALSLVAMFLFIERHREQGENTWLIWAGLATGLGALAREYGIVFAGLGALMLARNRAAPRNWATFLTSAFIVMLPWYARNWIKTGHPLFSHALGDVFPTNPVHLDYMRTVGEVFGVAHDPAGRILLLLTLLGQLAGVPLTLGLLGFVVRGRNLWPWATALSVVAALWLWSVHQTSGGYHYSLRALTPALAMAAVFGGLLLPRLAESRWAWLVAGVLTLPAVDAAQRALFMPLEPMVAWWQSDFLAWREHRQRVNRIETDGNWKAVADAAENRMILTNDPFNWVRLRERGTRTVTLFSPTVRFLFEPTIDLNAAVALLRAKGFRFIVLSRPDHVSNVQLDRVAFFHGLNQVRPTAIVPFGDIYDLYAPDLLSAGPRAPGRSPPPQR